MAEHPFSTGDVAKVSGAVGEAKRIAAADAKRRKQAARILNPKDVRGEYDAKRLLTTTLGGGIREITPEDLAAFRRNAEIIGNKYKGGITVRGVIDLSLAIDRKRARTQIPASIPIQARGVKGSGGGIDRLEVRFTTSASRLYGATRHFVVVEFLGYQTAIMSGAKVTAARAASWLAKQNIRFDCDCGRHTYWGYRYIATVGNYNAGRPESGYPKIRNPELRGIACKHVLRTMAEIEGSSTVQRFLTRAIEKGRATEDGNARIQQSAKEAKALAEKQAARPTPRRASGDRDFDRAARALRQQSRSRRPPPPKRVAPGSRRAQQLRDQQAMAALTALAAQFGMTPEQAAKLLGGK